MNRSIITYPKGNGKWVLCVKEQLGEINPQEHTTSEKEFNSFSIAS